MTAQIHAIIVWDSRFIDLTGLESQSSVFWISSFLSCGIPGVFLECIIKEYNPSVYNFNVLVLFCSYMFRLSLSTHHQAAFKKYKEKIVYP